MRCPMCDSKAEKISVKSMEHTKMTKYECNLCRENFITYEVYRFPDEKDEESEGTCIKRASLYQYARKRGL